MTPDEPGDDRLVELRMDADHAQRKLALYRARAYGVRPVSTARMRELERQAQASAARLKAAEESGR